MEPEIDPSIASSQLTPEQVVTIQVSSALESKQNPGALKTCYSLASPANRAFTGPFQRFAAMVFAPPYDQLGNAVSWQVGTAQIQQRMAVVLVSVLAADGATHAYRFYLSRQDQQPYQDCWMTDRVEALTSVAVGQPLGMVDNGGTVEDREEPARE
jgi:hypothetical protein